LDTLPHFGTVKGKIIEAIAVHDKREWGEIRDHLEFTNEELRPYIKSLEKENLLEETYGGFKVKYEIWLKYKAHYGEEWAIEKLEELRKENEFYDNLEKERQKILEKTYLKDRMFQWIKFKNIKMGKNSAHLFLTGDLLDSILKDLISYARQEIYVVNPFVERCALSDSLLRASRKGVKVNLITRDPKTDWDTRRKEDKQRYHQKLNNSSIDVHYNSTIHAKMFILDRQVLCVSSMNLYSDSVAGKSWEAGLLTIEETNIKRALNAFQELLN
jgi:hypothetical protein